MDRMRKNRIYADSSSFLGAVAGVMERVEARLLAGDDDDSEEPTEAPPEEPKKPLAKPAKKKKKSKKKGTKSMATKYLSPRALGRLHRRIARLERATERDEREVPQSRAATLEELSRPFVFGGGPGRPTQITELPEEDQIAVRQGFQSAAALRALNVHVTPSALEQSSVGHLPVRLDRSGMVTKEVLQTARAAAEEARRKALGVWADWGGR
jgi:hypothetical protein